MLAVHSLYGQIEPLVDYKYPQRKWVLNGEYSLEFEIYRSAINDESFDLLEGRSLIECENDYFRVTQLEAGLEVDTPYKKVTCVNDVIDILSTNFVYTELTGSISIVQAMNLITNGTKVTYALDGTFKNKTFEKFGNAYSYDLLKIILEKYKVEYDISKYHMTIKNRIGKDNDIQFRYKNNITGTDQQYDINTLRTYVKGFGKESEETDISTGVKSTLIVDDFDGKWDNSTSEELAEWNAKNTGVGMGKKTDVLGDSLQFRFTGTGFSIDMICTWLGGKVVFTIDGSNTKTVSLWSPITDQVKTFEIIRGLESKTHTVDVRLESRDGKNTLTKGDVLPVFHQPTGKILTTYRSRKGSEKYYASTEYLSPNSNIPQYGILHAEPIYNDEITNETDLLNFIIGELQDYPLVSTQFDYHTLVNDTGQEIERGDAGWLMHEKLGIVIYTRIVEIVDYPGTKKTPVVTIGNVLLNGTGEILKIRKGK